MINGMRTGFVLDGKGNRILPITHINLIIGDNGKSIRDSLDAVDNKLVSVQTYEDLLAFNTEHLFDGSIAYVVNDKTYYSYTSSGWELMTTGSSGPGVGDEEDPYAHIWVGAQPPENQNMVWIDTNSDGILEDESDINLLYRLLEEVNELKTEVVSLRKRVKYLEEHGVVVPDDPNQPEDPDDPVVDVDDIILLEDGSELLLEDGSELLLEEQVVDEPPVQEQEDDCILLEDGSILLFEDGSSIVLEVQSEKPIVKPTTEKVLLFENNTEILLENGNTILLEMQ